MLHPFVNTAVRCARRAGNIILRHLDKLDRITIEFKGRADWVSDVDRLCEEEIIGELSRAYPDHRIIGGESGAQPERKNGGEYCWLIDPLDGTTNFLHGFPHFAVSIACCRDDKVEHGVVFAPMQNELFTASRGQGAQLNDRRIRVSKIRKLENGLIATGFNFKEPSRLQPWLLSHGKVTAASGGVRRAGAAALDLAYVAAGRLEGFFEMGLSPWDYAAGSLLVEEAGGLISDFAGGNTWFDTGHITASNDLLHHQLLNLLEPCKTVTADT
jgi:myo-inositol-1(or 4)-monophosphatase